MTTSSDSARHNRQLIRSPKAAPTRRIRKRRRPARSVRCESSALNFVQMLERRLAELRVAKLQGWELAHEVLRMLRALLARETGVYDVTEGAALFSHNLWAGPSITRLIHDLNQRCFGILYQFETISLSDFARAEIFLCDLRELLNWYLTRKVCIERIEKSGSQWGEESLFDFKILHDRCNSGSLGFEAQCGLRLVGRLSQPLWLKVFVSDRRGPLAAARGWESWTDPMPQAGARRGTFAALLPILPDSQRLIIDAAKVFVPYAALGLEEERADVLIEASLTDARGEPLLGARQRGTFYVGSREPGLTPPVSPQARCAWPADAARGDSIANLDLAKVGEPGEGGAISMSFDISLFGQEDSELQMECRLLDDHGELIGGSAPECRDESGAFRIVETLYPRGPLVRYRGMALEIPLRMLELPPGRQSIECEISIMDGDRRVICAANERLELDLSIAPQYSAANGQRSRAVILHWPPQARLDQQASMPGQMAVSG